MARVEDWVEERLTLASPNKAMRDAVRELDSVERESEIEAVFGQLPELPFTYDDDERSDDTMWKAVVLGITMCWGTNFATIKYGMAAVPEEFAPALVAARFTLATLAMSPFLFQASSSQVVLKGLRIGGWCALGYASQALALSLGASASATAFECSLQTVLVAAVGLLAAGRTSNDVYRSLGSASLAVAGVASLCFLGSDEATSRLGSLVALGQAVGFGASYLDLEAAVDEHPDDALPLAAFQCLSIALFALGSAHAVDIHEFATTALANTSVLVSLAWLGLVSTALTIWLQCLAFKRVKASDASLILTSEPLWAAATAHVLLGETFGAPQLLGTSLILSAVALNDGLLDRFIFNNQDDHLL